jgi:hypothetical protein
VKVGCSGVGVAVAVAVGISVAVDVFGSVGAGVLVERKAGSVEGEASLCSPAPASLAQLLKSNTTKINSKMGKRAFNIGPILPETGFPAPNSPPSSGSGQGFAGVFQEVIFGHSLTTKANSRK